MVLLVRYAIWELGFQWFCISLCTSRYEMLQGNLFLFLLVTLYKGQSMVGIEIEQYVSTIYYLCGNYSPSTVKLQGGPTVPS